MRTAGNRRAWARLPRITTAMVTSTSSRPTFRVTPTPSTATWAMGLSATSSRAGLAVHTQYVKWGTAFVDIDNDGWKDLFIADGHVYPFIEKYNLGEEFHQPRQLFWNRGDGQFFDMSFTSGPGITAKHSSRGIAVGDLDNDGSEEIVVVNLFEPP